MSCWIITQSPIFKAAVPVAACTDWTSYHTTTNIPAFDHIFVKDDFRTGTEYRDRSPLTFAGQYNTPVLQIAGQVDYCVPASQGVQYHRALLERGVESLIATYPGEGHGVKSFPAYIDYCVRAVGWFEKFIPVDSET